MKKVIIKIDNKTINKNNSKEKVVANLHKKTLVSFFTLFIALVISVSSVFAWFSMNNKKTINDATIGITSSNKLGMGVDITNPDGVSVKNFENVLPGEIYSIKLTVFNFDKNPIFVSLLFNNLTIDVLYQEKDNTGERPIIPNITMLNVFAVKCLDANGDPINSKYKDFVYLVNNSLYNKETKQITVLNNYQIIGAGADNFSQTVIDIKLQFMNIVKDENDNTITQITDGINIIPISINVFQLQSFNIGILEIK